MAGGAPHGEIERVVIVTRSTELEDLAAQFATVPQARFVLTRSGRDFAPIEAAHDIYRRAVEQVAKAVPAALARQTIERALLPTYQFRDGDLVVAIGQDGLVCNTAKYLNGQMLLGVNPNPSLYDGVLLPARPDSIVQAMTACLRRTAEVRRVTMGELTTADGQRLLAFNDFFIGARSHVSARYELTWNGRSEPQSSSGIIVATGAGSTGWMTSVYRGAANLAAGLGAAPISLPPPLPWDSDELLFAVREPFPSRVTGCSIGYGRISAAQPLTVRSHMTAGGVAFSDGIESDFIEFNAGAVITIAIARHKALLVAP